MSRKWKVSDEWVKQTLVERPRDRSVGHRLAAIPVKHMTDSTFICSYNQLEV